MALAIETGTGSATSNSYVSVADFQTRNALRGIVLTGTFGTEEQILLIAMDYIESQDYLGTKNTKEQALQFPREGIYVDGFLVEDDEIPNELILAQQEVSIAIDGGNNPLSIVGREVKKEKVGDIEVTYQDNASDTVEIRAINAYLEKLIVGNAGGKTGYIGLTRA